MFDRTLTHNKTFEHRLAAVPAMIALRRDTLAPSGAVAVGIASIFLGVAHFAVAFPDLFAKICTEKYVSRAQLEHNPIVRLIAGQPIYSGPRYERS